MPVDFDHPLDVTWPGFLMPEALHLPTCPACGGDGYSSRARDLADQWYGNAPFQPKDTGSKPLTVRTRAVRAFAERNVARSPDFYGHGEAAIVDEAQRLIAMWNTQWSHHLDRDDVAALLAADRLRDLTHDFDPGRDPRWQPMYPPHIPSPAEVQAWNIVCSGHDAINRWVCVKARCTREGVAETCLACDGHGDVATAEQRAVHEAWTPTDPPSGEGWQVWESVSEGSPITPVMPTAQALVDYLSTYGTLCDQNRQARGRDGGGPWRREAAEAFVAAKWAPTFVSSPSIGWVEGGRDFDIWARP